MSTENTEESAKELCGILDLHGNKDPRVWDLVPPNLLEITALKDVAPPNTIFRHLVRALENESLLTETELIEFLMVHRGFGGKVPKNLALSNDILFRLIPPYRQVEFVWPNLDRLWSLLSTNAKILAVYRAAKENLDVSDLVTKLKGSQQINPLVKACLLIVGAKQYTYLDEGYVFRKAHALIQDYVVRTAMQPGAALDVRHLLPSCLPGEVEFCEGRTWNDPETGDRKKDEHGRELAFCPRRSGSCVVNDSHARIYASVDWHWERWSLNELMNYCGVQAQLPELRDLESYVLKLSGWVNRIFEVRERLKCSHCGITLIPDMGYAKNLAAYCNVMVSRCPNGHESVYLTHCWVCNSLVDSRECTVQEGGYYLCLQCGSSPRKHESVTFSLDDICPKCGHNKMIDCSVDSRERVCVRCFHGIKLPPSFNIKGTLDHRTDDVFSWF